MIKDILALPNDSVKKTLTVAFALCLVCSVLVSAAAVILKPMQEANKTFDKKRNILQIAGLMEEGKSVDELYQQIEARVIDTATGEYVDGTDDVDAQTYDQRKASNDPKQNYNLEKQDDIASIKRRAKYTSVYFFLLLHFCVLFFIFYLFPVMIVNFLKNIGNARKKIILLKKKTQQF